MKASRIMLLAVMIVGLTGMGAAEVDPETDSKLFYSFDDFNDGDSIVTDESGSFDGDIVGDPNSVSGISGSALSFDSSNNERIEVSDNSVIGSFDDLEGEYTVSSWFRIPNSMTDGDRVMLYSEGRDSDDSLIQMKVRKGDFNDDGTVRTALNFYDETASGSGLIKELEGLDDGEWYHVVFTRESDRTMSIYLDSNFEDSLQAVGDIGSHNSDSNTVVGARTFDGGSSYERFLDGQLDEIMVFDKVLTDSEIDSLYNLEYDEAPVFDGSVTLNDPNDQATIPYDEGLTFDWDVDTNDVGADDIRLVVEDEDNNVVQDDSVASQTTDSSENYVWDLDESLEDQSGQYEWYIEIDYDGLSETHRSDETRTFTIESLDPPQINLNNPADDVSLGFGTDESFDWDVETFDVGADDIRFVVEDSAGSTIQSDSVASQTDNSLNNYQWSLDDSVAENSGQYNWFIEVDYDGSETTSSNVRSFEILDADDPVADLTNPADGASFNYDEDFQFEWTVETFDVGANDIRLNVENYDPISVASQTDNSFENYDWSASSINDLITNPGTYEWFVEYDFETSGLAFNTLGQETLNNHMNTVVIHPSGDYVVAGDEIVGTYTYKVFDTSDGSVVDSQIFDDFETIGRAGADFHPNGNSILLTYVTEGSGGEEDQQIIEYDFDNGNIGSVQNSFDQSNEQDTDRSGNSADQVSYIQGGDYILASGNDALVLDSSFNLVDKTTTVFYNSGREFDENPTNNEVAVTSTDDAFYIYDVSGGSLSLEETINIDADRPGVAYTENYLFAIEDDTLYKLDHSGNTQSTITLDDSNNGLYPTENRNLIVVGLPDSNRYEFYDENLNVVESFEASEIQGVGEFEGTHAYGSKAIENEVFAGIGDSDEVAIFDDQQDATGFSGTRTFTVNEFDADTPVLDLISPSDQASFDLGEGTTFEWSVETGNTQADDIRLVVEDDTGTVVQEDSVASQSTDSSETYTQSLDEALEDESGNYEWYVEVDYDGSQTTTSETRTFSISDADAPQASLINPANQETFGFGSGPGFEFEVQTFNIGADDIRLAVEDDTGTVVQDDSVASQGPDSTETYNWDLDQAITEDPGNYEWYIEVDYDGSETTSTETRTFEISSMEAPIFELQKPEEDKQIISNGGESFTVDFEFTASAEKTGSIELLVKEPGTESFELVESFNYNTENELETFEASQLFEGIEYPNEVNSILESSEYEWKVTFQNQEFQIDYETSPSSWTFVEEEITAASGIVDRVLGFFRGYWEAFMDGTSTTGKAFIGLTLMLLVGGLGFAAAGSIGAGFGMAAMFLVNTLVGLFPGWIVLALVIGGLAYVLIMRGD